MRTSALAAILLLAASACKAETYTRLYEEGVWTLYSADGVSMTINGKRSGTYDGVCLAESTSDGKTLKISLLPSAFVEMHPRLRGHAWIQVHDASWHFSKRQARARLSVGMSSYGANDARYLGQTITFNATNFEQFGVFLMFAGASRYIDLLDWKGLVIGRFSTEGFVNVRDRLLKCSGS